MFSFIKEMIHNNNEGLSGSRGRMEVFGFDFSVLISIKIKP